MVILLEIIVGYIFRTFYKFIYVILVVTNITSNIKFLIGTFICLFNFYLLL